VSLTPPSSVTSASVVPAARTLYAASVVPSWGGKAWWTLSAGTGLSAMILLFLPGRKRYRAALGLGLVCLLSFTLGCGGSSYNNSGPVATTTALSVPATRNPANATITVTPVSGAAAQGTASLNDLSTVLSTQVSITNGIGMTNLALATAGTHSLQASYAGSTTDAASRSGMLNVTVTGGPQQVTITGASGPTTASGTINVTIN